MTKLLPFTHPLHMVLGLFVWGAWFAGSYSLLSVACSIVQEGDALAARSWINVALLGIAALVTALLALLAWRCWHNASQTPRERLTRWVATAGYGAGALAVAVNAFPLLVLPPCL